MRAARGDEDSEPDSDAAAASAGLVAEARLLWEREETWQRREAMEKAFECRVFDYFGLAERTIFAVECDRHEGHHLCEEYGVTEVLGSDDQPLSDGLMGKMVTTSLHNRAMPLIRYVTNDMTALKPEACSCGRGLRLMEDVTTKAEDILTLADGRLISSSVLTHPFKPLNSVRESQIIQKDYDHVVVLVEPAIICNTSPPEI